MTGLLRICFSENGCPAPVYVKCNVKVSFLVSNPAARPPADMDDSRGLPSGLDRFSSDLGRRCVFCLAPATQECSGCAIPPGWPIRCCLRFIDARAWYCGNECRFAHWVSAHSVQCPMLDSARGRAILVTRIASHVSATAHSAPTDPD